MELTLRILLGLVALICLLGGANLLIKGANSFLPAGTPSQPVIDNLFRFLSGIYFGLGFLMVWVIIHFHEVHGLVYFIGFVVICSGMGRLYSKVKVGSAGRYFDNIMIVEILLGVSIILIRFFLHND